MQNLLCEIYQAALEHDFLPLWYLTYPGSLVQTCKEFTSHILQINFMCSSTLIHPKTKYTFLLFFVCLFSNVSATQISLNYFQGYEEAVVWTCAFSLCISTSWKVAVSISNKSVANFFQTYVLWWVFDFHFFVPYLQGLYEDKQL